MISIEHLTKYYGGFRAVDDVSFTVKDGEILGFLGPNGAGKTTTLKMLTCFMPPNEGTIRFNDFNVREHSMEIRKMIGYLPENAPLYEYMGVMEFLNYVCDIREIYGQKRKDRISNMIDLCGLDKVLGKDIGELSKGYRQRVGISQAMIHEPDILILDEPTVGLDPNQVVGIRQLIKDVGKEKTVVLSTHILSEVEAVCKRVVIISSGSIVADGETGVLMSELAGHSVIQITLKGNIPDANIVFSTMKEVDHIDVHHGNNGEITCLDIFITGPHDIREEIFNRIVQKKWVLLGMTQQKKNLEDVFRQLTLSQADEKRGGTAP
ncbi:ATP-binding cassette domain-containing protein [Candidatus Latescibacterota bacterium]